ncbi:MAG: creatininase family protein [Pseudomonadota bacterium]
MAEVDWARLKAHELRALATAGAAVILPIAAIEQHGPHLPVMTDTCLGTEIAHRAARIAYPTRPVVVTPPVWSGLSEHHMAFGGTLSISHATFRALLSDLIACLVRLGFRDVLIANSHGGNILAMKGLVEELSATTPATLVAMSYPDEAGPEFNAVLEGQETIQHACEAETSMMLAVVPDLVDRTDLPGLRNARPRDMYATGRGSYRWRPIHQTSGNGINGDPTLSSPEKGERLLTLAAEGMAALVTDPTTWAVREDLRGLDTGGVPFAPGT